jgi:NAD(P)H dehydrogenase (quinone)
MYAVTGVSRQLGNLIVKELIKSAPPANIVAVMRTPEKAGDLESLGLAVRLGNYDQPETLVAALAGVERLLLVSSDLTGRLQHHKPIIEAAKAAGVKLLAYASMLHADQSPTKLAKAHLETEHALIASGMTTVFLRNGRCTENYLLALRPALVQGALYGAAGEGRISPAACSDYAAAASVVLLSNNPARVYELAGDSACTLGELAAEISRQAGQEVAHHDLPQEVYESGLVAAGLSAEWANLLADADARAAEGALFDAGQALRRLIGRPTTPAAETIAASLRELGKTTWF